MPSIQPATQRSSYIITENTPRKIQSAEPALEPSEFDLSAIDLNSIRSGALRISVPLKEGSYVFPGKYKPAHVIVDPNTMAFLTVSLGKNPWNETVFTYISVQLSRAVKVMNPSSAYEEPGWCNGFKDLFAEVQIEGIDVSPEGQLLFQGKLKKGFMSEDIQESFKPDMFPQLNLHLEDLKKLKQDSSSSGVNPSEILTKLGVLLGEANCSAKLDTGASGFQLGLHVRAKLTPDGELRLKTDDHFQSAVDFLDSQAVLKGELSTAVQFQTGKPTKVSGVGMLDAHVAESKPISLGALKTKFRSAHVHLEGNGEVLGKQKSMQGKLRVDVADPQFEWRGLHGSVQGKAGLQIQVRDLMSGMIDYHVESESVRPFWRKLGYQIFPHNRLALNPVNTGMSEFLDPVSQFVWNAQNLADPVGPFVGDLGSVAWREHVQAMTGAPIRRHNKVTLLVDGMKSFPRRIELIKNAKRSICLQSLIFKSDESGLAIAKALVEAHQRGVQVRVIVDSLGNLDSVKELIRGNQVYEFLRDHGVQLELYSNQAIRGLRDMLTIVEQHRALQGLVSLKDFVDPQQTLSTLHMLVKVAYGSLHLDLTQAEREKIHESLKMILGDDDNAQSLIERLFHITPERPLQLSEIVSILSQVLSLNHRWHEKYLVVDGEKAILGGMNLADEYLKGGGGTEVMVAGISRPAWRDTDILIEGEGALDAYRCFSKNWKTVSGQELSPEVGSWVDSGENVDLQVIQSSPGVGICHPITNLKIEAIKTLKPGDKAYEATAYFMPTGALRPYIEVLKMAALRGVDVRIVTNSMDTTDMPQVNQAAVVSCYRELLKAGIRIWERTGERTMHQKTASYGSKLALVGSYNLDNRSASLNSECLVAVHDANMAQEVERMLLRDMESDVAIEKKFEDFEAFEPLDELKHSAWAMLGDLM